ncbi:MAG: ATP-dependent sacrificial sulfur transferase LarE [Phycisphaerae bacterium]|nr:ATP-dependent sacrificial sulfur transferase LarE [Phycisphaerae bacterium]
MTVAELLDALDPALRRKVQLAQGCLKRLRRVVVAFSGGVDSTLVLALAVETLGKGNVVATMGISAIHPRRECQAGREIAGQLGVELVELETTELTDPQFLANSPQRCYICKRHVMGPMVELAGRRGCAAVVSGTNADDLGDFRPGIQAAQELGIVNPLIEAGMTKDDIRAVSKALGLVTWDKPSMACLATRVPYGQPLTTEALGRIEQAEDALRDMGFATCRVRDHFPVARIELEPNQLSKALRMRQRITERIKATGYTFVALDLGGFRSGSMNEALSSPSGPKDS